MWDLCAGEAVPLANTLNSLMNTVNAILQGIRALDARQNALRDFTKTFVVRSCMTPPFLKINAHYAPSSLFEDHCPSR